MCNIENVKYSIELMRNTKNLDMMYYQDTPKGQSVKKTTAQLHRCRTPACFAGEVAVSRKFRQDGGRVDIGGMPVMGSADADCAIALWLSIDPKLAENLCGLGDSTDVDDFVEINNFYGKELHEVTPDDVIEKLEELLAGCE